ncbi:MAG TPA: MmgE/PrpD family protein [Burkholderiales bacterium]|nr:MmgE/PrpD family protein [Burkholderiales bacterium]
MNSPPAQWDATTRRLLEYARDVRFGRLDARTLHEVKRHLLDTFASALGALDEPVCVMARALGAQYRSMTEARLWGSGRCTTPEMAGFTNGVMVRALDISDTCLGKSRGHPSDMVPGLIAVAEAVRADGPALIEAISLAYDVYCSFCAHVDVNARGWDQPVYGVLGCALGAAKLMRLSDEQTGHALSLALTPNMALAEARRGSLSSWKGCAGANASRNAVFAAVLAQQGFTGPAAPFEGSGGLWAAIGRADWPLPSAPMIGTTHTKSLPVCYHGQSAVLAALELRRRVALEAIEAIEVAAYATAVFMMGADPSRWAPATRETADHSFPYCIALALLDGELTQSSFAEARLRDPAVKALMAKVKVVEDPALSALYPHAAPGRVAITLRSGETQVAEVRYPTGHEKNPMSDQAIERKWIELSRGRVDAGQSAKLVETLWRLESLDDARALTALLAANG